MQEHPEVNATSAGTGGAGAGVGSLDQMLVYLTESWNRHFPEDPKVAGDFHMNDHDPWREPPAPTSPRPERAPDQPEPVATGAAAEGENTE